MDRKQNSGKDRLYGPRKQEQRSREDQVYLIHAYRSKDRVYTDYSKVVKTWSAFHEGV